jgi:hypothetical protein
MNIWEIFIEFRFIFTRVFIVIFLIEVLAIFMSDKMLLLEYADHNFFIVFTLIILQIIRVYFVMRKLLKYFNDTLSNSSGTCDCKNHG